MARSPITPLVVQFQNLTADEQKIFLDLVDPRPEPGPVAKQTRKKRGPSKKAQSLSTAITSSRAAKSDGEPSGNEGDGDLVERSGLCGICGNSEGFHDHSQPSPNYHVFEGPKVRKASGK